MQWILQNLSNMKNNNNSKISENKKTIVARIWKLNPVTKLKLKVTKCKIKNLFLPWSAKSHSAFLWNSRFSDIAVTSAAKLNFPCLSSVSWTVMIGFLSDIASDISSWTNGRVKTSFDINSRNAAESRTPSLMSCFVMLVIWLSYHVVNPLVLSSLFRSAVWSCPVPWGEKKTVLYVQIFTT